jgi:hypothetical protein
LVASRSESAQPILVMLSNATNVIIFFMYHTNFSTYAGRLLLYAYIDSACGKFNVSAISRNLLSSNAHLLVKGDQLINSVEDGGVKA